MKGARRSVAFDNTNFATYGRSDRRLDTKRKETQNVGFRCVNCSMWNNGVVRGGHYNTSSIVNCRSGGKRVDRGYNTVQLYRGFRLWMV